MCVQCYASQLCLKQGCPSPQKLQKAGKFDLPRRRSGFRKADILFHLSKSNKRTEPAIGSWAKVRDTEGLFILDIQIFEKDENAATVILSRQDFKACSNLIFVPKIHPCKGLLLIVLGEGLHAGSGRIFPFPLCFKEKALLGFQRPSRCGTDFEISSN